MTDPKHPHLSGVEAVWVDVCGGGPDLDPMLDFPYIPVDFDIVDLQKLQTRVNAGWKSVADHCVPFLVELGIECEPYIYPGFKLPQWFAALNTDENCAAWNMYCMAVKESTGNLPWKYFEVEYLRRKKEEGLNLHDLVKHTT